MIDHNTLLKTLTTTFDYNDIMVEKLVKEVENLVNTYKNISVLKVVNEDEAYKKKLHPEVLPESLDLYISNVIKEVETIKQNLEAIKRCAESAKDLLPNEVEQNAE